MKRDEENKFETKERRLKMETYSGKIRKLVNVQQLSEIIGVKVATIYSWVSREYIPHIKLGRLVRFDLDAVFEWIAGKAVIGRNSRLPKENFLF